MGSETLPGGTLIGGRYLVEAVLWRGPTAVVYRARDQRLRRAVAVKLPEVRILDQPGVKERFEREINSLVALDHPHILKALDAGMRGVRPYVVLPYLEGGSLADRLAQAPGRRMSLEDVGAWLPTAAATLDFVHGRGVVHRDVKPGNILFDGSDHVFLADFGFARVLREPGLTPPGTVLGSPVYMAPEQLRGGTPTPAADQYGLAATVFEALAGRPPFRTAPMHALLDAKLNAEPPAAEHVPPAIRRALARDPAARFESCAAFAAAVSGA